MRRSLRLSVGLLIVSILVFAVGVRAESVDFEQLRGMLDDPDPSVRREAIRELRSAGAEAVPLLTRVLQEDQDYGVRWTAVNTIGSIGGEETLPILMAALSDESGVVREAAAVALGQRGAGAVSATAALADALLDEEARVRAAAANSLGQIGEGAKEALPVLMVTLQDSDFSVRMATERALRKIDQDYKLEYAVQALLALVQEEGGSAGWAIARTLKRIDPDFSDELSGVDVELRRLIDSLSVDIRDFSLMVTRPGASGVVFKDEDAAVRVEVYNRSDFRWEGQIHVECTFDSPDRPEIVLPLPIVLEPTSAASQTFEVPTDMLGYWRIRVAFECGSERTPAKTAAVAVVDRPVNYGQDDPDSFFGSMFIGDYEAADRLGIKTDRIQAYWRYISSIEGSYDWSGLDEQISKARSHGISIILTVRPENRFDTNLRYMEEPYIESYRKFVRDLVERYKDQVAAIELLNEPDLMFYYQHRDEWSEEEGIMLTSILHREGYKVVKEVAPKLPVLGMSVSGVDQISWHLRFTKGVLELGKDPALDMFAGHPYSHSRLIQDNRSFEWPHNYDLRGKLINAQDRMEDHDLTREYWSTELGWAYKSGSDPLGDAARKHAAVVARALIEVKSVPGVEKLIWFAFSPTGTEHDGYYYGLIYTLDGYNYPYPAVNSYATTARLLHHTEPGGLLDTDSQIRAFRFDSADHGRTIVTLWSDESDLEIAVSGVDSLEVFDMYGRCIATGSSVSVALSHEPLYFTVPREDGDRMAEQLEGAVVSSTDSAAVE